MKIHLQYGRDGLDVRLPADNITLLRPRFIPGLADEAEAFARAVKDPIESRPLAELIGALDTVAVVIADITRALPSNRLLPWLFSALSHVPIENFTIIIGTGTHRACTQEEMAQLVGRDVAKRVRVINHDAYDEDKLTTVGQLHEKDGRLQLNTAYVEADKRIILGFIEPHFMAGFSGGYKAVFPGVAGIEAIMHYHRAEMIAHPHSVWGVLEDNPTQNYIRRNGSALPVDFCINLTLNHEQAITRFFCGDVLAAHARGCAFAKETAMVAVERPFPIVVTSNSGYPLDLNLYQAVKGMAAAAEIVTEGGLVIAAARCHDGFPDHGNFTKLLLAHDSPQALLHTINAPGFHMLDQWQAQKLALVQVKARVALFSELPPADVARVRIEPIADMTAFIEQEVAKLGSDVPIAVLPEGPMTIPYLA